MSPLHRYSHLAVLGVQANTCTQGENVGEVVLLEHMGDINNLSLILSLGARQCCFTPWIKHCAARYNPVSFFVPGIKRVELDGAVLSRA